MGFGIHESAGSGDLDGDFDSKPLSSDLEVPINPATERASR